MTTSGSVVRKVRVVDGGFQYRVVALALLVVVIGLAVFAAVAALFYGISSATGHPPDPRLLLAVLPALLLNDLAIMVVAIIVGIAMSHRIAGPVYRIASDIDRALAGERGVRVSLRRKDALGELAEKVNRLFERIDGKRAG